MKPRPLSEIPERFHAQIMQQLHSANRKDREAQIAIPAHPKPVEAPKPTKRPKFLNTDANPFKGLGTPEREYRFHPTRRFRFDWAWPEQKLALEIDGGLFIKGGHSRGAAREYDMARDAEAMMLGWRVLRVSPRHLKSGDAARWVAAILAL